ncbi:protein-glutamine glutaminase family protein [Bdellovibrio sp. 22V]|uniref:protein-glutamine glutaminase family protein n=1 Tax=Bdellovibrio sp. 22V TaxID=3044166 RepID=UPI002542B9EB|nr:protein-glutamine glutaminase family protein [Bdellovibrio sp. 22V]WII72770.1 protein-glutamine glutaminase family protein [Bdellovibrio sp. 22V]
MKLFAFILALGFSLTGFASTKGVSAVRHAHESYDQALHRHLFLNTFQVQFPLDRESRSVPAERAKKPLKNLNLNDIPDVGSYADLENEFKYIRDTRFMKSQDPHFPRRMTWLYPDDGCYARAEMAKVELVDHHFPAPKKLFVFGNLYAKTSNSPTGDVQWWYHVAVTYRVGNEAYVFDPAVEPKRPLKITEWNDLIGGSKAVLQYSICSAHTFDPMMDCYHPHEMTTDEAIYEQKAFFSDEWDRLLELKRSPEKELGNYPPWLEN